VWVFLRKEREGLVNQKQSWRKEKKGLTKKKRTKVKKVKGKDEGNDDRMGVI
jgi:hypothetical protein